MELFAEKLLIVLNFDDIWLVDSQQNYFPNMLFGNQKSTECVLSAVNDPLVLRAGHVQFEIIVILICEK